MVKHFKEVVLMAEDVEYVNEMTLRLCLAYACSLGSCELKRSFGISEIWISHWISSMPDTHFCLTDFLSILLFV